MRNFFFWYFQDAPKFLVDFFIKILKFILYFFGFFIHLRHLFLPWKHISISYGRGFQASVFFYTLALNGTSRIVGFFLRLIIIVWTLLLFLLALFLGLGAILLWFCLPILVIYFLVSLFFI